MSERLTFLDRALRGEIYDPTSEIDDAVDEWHGSGSGSSLREWLGMSADEYALFVEEPANLVSILKARRYGLDVTELARSREQSGELAVAARGLDARDVDEVIAWLRRTGRL